MQHRTALITAGSMALVLFAGAVAVGANLGILNAADSRPVGKLSAVADVQPAGPEMVRVYAGTRPLSAQPQPYVIKQAGTVSVSASKAGLRLVDVVARPGWKWSLEQTSDKKLTVTFRSGARTYTFQAHLGPDHSIVARVDKPVTRVVPSTSSGTVVAMSAPPATTSAPAAAPGTQAGTGHGDDDGGGEADD
jgi:hypothetical protein